MDANEAIKAVEDAFLSTSNNDHLASQIGRILFDYSPEV